MAQLCLLRRRSRCSRGPKAPHKLNFPSAIRSQKAGFTVVFPGMNREGHRGIALRLESVAGAATCTALPALGGIDARLIYLARCGIMSAPTLPASCARGCGRY